MYPESYKKWQFVSQSEKSPDYCAVYNLQKSATIDPTHKCINLSNNIHIVGNNEFRSLFDVEMDKISHELSACLVNLSGPQYYCDQCGKYFSSTNTCLDSDIPQPNVRYSVSWANLMMQYILTSDLTMEEIAKQFYTSKSVLSRILTNRTKHFLNSSIESYAPCDILIIYPFTLGKATRCFIGGFSADRLLMYDLLPTCDTDIIRSILNRIPSREICGIVIGMYPKIYHICRAIYPDIAIFPTSDRADVYIRQLSKTVSEDDPLCASLRRLETLLQAESNILDNVQEWYQNLPKQQQMVCANLYSDILMSCGAAINRLPTGNAQKFHFQKYIDWITKHNNSVF